MKRYFRMYVIGLVPDVALCELEALIKTADFCAISETGQTFPYGMIVTVQQKFLEACDEWKGIAVGEVGEQFKILGHEANGRICKVERLASQ